VSDEDDYLMLSGLKHFQFCKRRWALIHIEQLWSENVLTLDGHYMHERVHDRDFSEKRGAVLLSRAMPVKSHNLKITGECDMVELYQSDDGVSIQGRDGRWKLYPVEYKRGSPDSRGADEIQLCAQAICLEEMFVTEIKEGAIYYGESRHRKIVLFTEELRNTVRINTEEMHRLFERGYTPKAKFTKACKNCSIYELCEPELSKYMKVSEYVNSILKEVKE
jgi:CRISPR-associated exonuclease Cas4